MDGVQGQAAIVVDEEKCSSCGECVRVCPHSLLQSGERAIEVEAEGCMQCGHCAAVCLSGAITLHDQPLHLGLQTFHEHTESVPPGESDSAELVRLMRSRRSCRCYEARQVPMDILEDLVKIGTTAPSGTNSQPWNFIILPSRDDVEVLGGLTAEFYRKLNSQARNPFYRMLARVVAGDSLGRYYRSHYQAVDEALEQWQRNGTDKLFHGATAAILVTGRRDASCPAEDALLATQNMLLAAHSLGLGSCLIGFVVEALRRCGRSRRSMAIPAEEEIYSVIGLGYPAVKYQYVTGRQPVQPRVLHLAKR